MADYKELLRRAIEVLPENNGAARRAVYEKARSALVGQLRAINPPLAARDITQHRLQLEDCIRDVEREASEANVAGLKSSKETPARAAEAAPVQSPPPASAPVETTAQQVFVPPAPVPQAPVPQASPPQAQAPAASAAAAPVVQAFRPVSRPVIVEPGPAAMEVKPASAEAAPSAAVMTPVFLRPVPVQASEPVAEAPPAAKVTDEQPETGSIEDIIAAAERAAEQAPAEPEPQPELVIELKPEPQIPAAALGPVEANVVPPLFKLEPRPLSTIVSPVKPPVPANSGFAEAKPFEPVRRGPTFDLRREAISTSQIAEVASASALRFEPAMRSQTIALQQVAEPIAILDHPSPPAPAMSAVREVEVEPSAEVAAKEAQVTIERAIATLDREARGETSPLVNGADAAPGSPPPLLGLKRDQVRPVVEQNLAAEQAFARPQADDERGGFNAITIFLVVFALLLTGAGGAGFWAWREGYIDFQAMFGNSANVASSDAQLPTPNASPTVAASTADPAAPAAGPGNTATPGVQAPVTELKTDERLAGTPVGSAAAAAPVASSTPPTPLPVDPATPQSSEIKTEERLSVAATPAAPQAAPSANPAIDPTAAAGSQSLLLEASDDGTTGAVPFSGTVEWSQGKDEMNQPTLVGKASIPARNLTVDVLIRKNSDPSLPASHLMEINFSVTDSFIGGSIAGLPGVLLKNEELVQGTPLVGASARVVGNSFLFALSASAEDATTNTGLLTSRKWIDLAIVYATGKRAIITLEKDGAADKLFADVFKAWSDATPAAASAAQ